MKYFLILIVFLMNPWVFGSELWTVEGRTDQLKDPVRIMGKIFDDLEFFLHKPDHLSDEQHEYMKEMAHFFSRRTN